MKMKGLLQASFNFKRYENAKKMSLIEAGSSGSSGTSRDPNATTVASVTPSLGGNSGDFTESVVDLSEIYNAYSSDGYIRRAVDNVSTLMLKSGYELKGRNKDTLTYVKTRLKLIEESTDISFDELITELADNYVLYANAPLAKSRGQENLAGLQATGYYGGEPISGFFPINPRYFAVKADEFGTVEEYQASSDSGEGVTFSVEDVSHLHYRRQTGTLYGIPYFQNVLDDVLILRNIEENVSQLIYRNLFPLTTYTIGTTEKGFEATDEEIEDTVAKLQEMRLDEIHVLPERHKIATVNNGNAVMDVSNYLSYFRQRVFTGLGMSETVMGVSGTSNKSTADNQNSDLNDLVKDFQKRFRSQIQLKVINEILYEGGYDPVLNEEDEVTFEFVEIEQSAKIARENHIVNLWNNKLIDFDEARVGLGYDPVEDLSKFQPILFADTSTTIKDGAVDNADQPENQYGKATNPSDNQTKEKKSRKKVLTEATELVNFSMSNGNAENQATLSKYWHIVEKQLKLTIQKDNYEESYLSDILESSKPKLSSIISSLSEDSLNLHLKMALIDSYQEADSIKEYFKSISEATVDRLFISLNTRLHGLSESSDKSTFIESVFNSFDSRLSNIKEFHESLGMNISEALNAFENGQTFIEIQTEDSACETCSGKIITREKDWFKQVPPYHAHCFCKVTK